VHSLSKTSVPAKAIHKIVHHHFGAQRAIRILDELTDGLYNAAYRIELSDGLACILKVAPPDHVRVLRYERGIMQAEVETMRLVRAQTEVPVPEIYTHDTSRRLIDNDYYLMACIPGTPLNKLRKSLSEQEQHEVDRQAGRLTRQINALHGPAFGYVAQPERHASSWRVAFADMLDGVLADGIDAGVALPLPYEEIRERVSRWYSALDAVTVPQLVHWDLWDGNIFVDPVTRRINGIVDFERALWGDPLMECQFEFRGPQSAYAEGYGQPMFITEEDVIRRTLYNVYLYAIMVIECTYRQYDNDNQERWARGKLAGELARLGTPPVV
jgi:Ser/Thr protein kinase RdoA (MazF antagonist)